MHPRTIILWALVVGAALSWLPYCLIADLVGKEVNVVGLVAWCMFVACLDLLVLIRLLSKWFR